MKKHLFFAALALVAMASCTSDENVTVVSPPDPVTEEVEPAISFNMGSRTATRADHFGKAAADLLNNKFIVSAFKGDGSAMTVTMPDYIVTYADNTAGNSESNTSNWEYVGITAEDPSSISGNKQTIKYWDYSTDQYDFIAYSTSDATITTTGSAASAIANHEVVVTPIDRANAKTNAYQFGGSVDELKKCYVADMVTVYKDGTDGKKYGEEVQLVFRNLTSKVRVAIYETIPGYSVKDVKFYTNASTTLADGASATDATLFTTATTTKDNFYTGGVYMVKFPTIGKAKVTPTKDTDYNKAHVVFTPSSSGTTTTQSYGALNYVGKEAGEADEDVYLGRTLPLASYAGVTADNYYKTVLPNEEGTVLELRIDYTLLATDGSGEEIKIHGATAFVPAIYAAWKPNYAYTYIFKISDNTNGWTSTAGGGPTGTDPEGLYPITFNAVVIDSEENTQSTITTVATPSITTYQKGHDVGVNEYNASDGDIYVQVMTDGVLATNLKDAGVSKLYTLTGKENPTEADVMDALNINAEVSATADLINGLNGVVLTSTTITNNVTAVPGADGNDITVDEGTAAKFTPAAGTYAYAYLVQAGTAKTIYTPETLYTRPSDWEQSNLWYVDPDGVTEATGFTSGAVYYKKRYTNLNNVYGVKIIKVQ